MAALKIAQSGSATHSAESFNNLGVMLSYLADFLILISNNNCLTQVEFVGEKEQLELTLPLIAITLGWSAKSTPTDNLGEELMQALLPAIERQIDKDRTLMSDFTHTFQSTTFTVREFEEGSERLHTYLQSLAAKLNSNEEFTPGDTFTMETTFNRTPGPGSGHSKRYKPSKAASQGITKKSRVTIKNKDQLCCARAIVTMKALADANGNTCDQDYHNLKQGYPVRERKAKELH